MSESDKQKQWSKQYNWATCQEPYKTELDTYGSHWIEGTLTDAELALELLKIQFALGWHGEPGPGSHLPKMTDVLSQVAILVDALCSSVKLDSERGTPESRREWLDDTRQHAADEQHRQR